MSPGPRRATSVKALKKFVVKSAKRLEIEIVHEPRRRMPAAWFKRVPATHIHAVHVDDVAALLCMAGQVDSRQRQPH